MKKELSRDFSLRNLLNEKKKAKKVLQDDELIEDDGRIQGTR